MTTVAPPPQNGYQTIRLPLAASEYDRFLTDRSSAKDRLEALSEAWAALLPDAFPSGSACFGSTEPSMTQHLTLALCEKRDQFSKSYDCPEAQRTSHRGDRLMKFVDRALFHAQYFHGMPDAAESRGRA